MKKTLDLKEKLALAVIDPLVSQTRAWQDTEEGIDSVNKNVSESKNEIVESISAHVSELNETLKKKLDEELLYEVDEGKIVDSVLAKVKIPDPIPGTPGKDADQEAIIKEMVPLVLERIPAPETIDIEGIAKKAATYFPKTKPQIVKQIDQDKVVAEVLQKMPKLEPFKFDLTQDILLEKINKFNKEVDWSILKNIPYDVLHPPVGKGKKGGGGSSTFRQLTDVSVPNPTNGQVPVYNSTTSKWEAGSVTSSPGGSTTQVQFNDSGAFGGDAGFTYDKTTDTATLGNLTLTNALPPASGGWGVAMTPQTISSGTTFNALTPGLISFTSSGSNITINGITAPTSASGGFTRIQNNTPGSTTVSLANQSGSATAANRIISDLAGQAYALSRGQGVDLYYDTSISRWRVLRFGVSAVSAPLTLSSKGLLAMTTAGPSQAGYITNVDYSRWEQKLGDSDPLTTSIAHSVPYFLDVDLDVPKKVTSSNEFLYNPTLKMLGSGVPYADIAAKMHSQSGTVLTVADPDSSSCPVYQYQVDIPATPASVSIYQDLPDIARYTDNGSSASNAGAGGYAAADVVDYIVTAGYDDGSNPIVWSVATGTITGITDGANTFDVSISINNATYQNFATNVWSFSRQVNGGGYNDYQRFTTVTPTDTNSGWTAGADPSGFTPLADDFLANGTDYTGIIQFYETWLSPDTLVTIVSSVYDPAFIDDNSGNAYKMYVNNIPLHSYYGVRVSWPGTRNFEAAPNSSYVGYFTSGPIGVTSSGAPTTTPTSWGYLSNGTNLTNTFDYYSSATAGGFTYYSVNSYQTVFTDPNDGNYYYYLLGSALVAGKMKKDSLYKVFAVSDFLYDGDASVYPDNSTLTPKSFAYPADRTDTKGTTSAEFINIVHHALDASGRIYHSWTDDTNAEIASMKVDSTGAVTFDAVGASAGFTFSDPVNITSSLQCDSIVNDTGLASGTYTPTLTGVNNVSSSTARLATYMRVGNTVTVAGQIDVTPTANNAQTTIGISLPIASAFTTAYQAGGSGHTVANTTAGHVASIQADATNDRAELDYYETHGATDTISYSFTYEVI